MIELSDGNIALSTKDKPSHLFSIEKEPTLVNTTKFSVTNKYVLPFLYYQVSADSLDFSMTSKEQIKELFNVEGVILSWQIIIVTYLMKKELI